MSKSNTVQRRRNPLKPPKDSTKTVLGAGRPRKDGALRLRDQYWICHLKDRLPGETFASLERRLGPHLRVTRRSKEEGLSQPFAYSKVARGVRGLSASLEDVPLIVHRAEDLTPGVQSAFTSILWTALAKPGTRCGSISPEVRVRLHDRHYSKKPGNSDDPGMLNAAGIRRISRLWHRDAMGLLLCHCPVAIGYTYLSFQAESYLLHLLHWCSRSDPAIQRVSASLAAIIDSRYPMPHNFRVGYTQKIFPAPKGSTFLMGLRMMLGP